MYKDAQALLWASAALTASAVSTNSYDLGAVAVASTPAPDPSIGQSLAAVVNVEVAADSTTGNETYEFDWIQSTVTALTTPDVLVQFPFTAAQAAAGALALGTILVLPLPPGSVTKRHIGLQYVGGGTTPTITVSAHVTLLSMAMSIPKHYGTKIVIL